MGDLETIDESAGKRAIFADPASNTLYTTDPATGELVQIVDPETGAPLKKCPLFVDPNTGTYCTMDIQTGKASPIIDPLTGEPMNSSLPQENPAHDALPDVDLDEQALAEADAPDHGIRCDTALFFADEDAHAQSKIQWGELVTGEAVEIEASYVPPAQLPSHDFTPRLAEALDPHVRNTAQNVASPAEIEAMEAEIKRLNAQIQAQSHWFALVCIILAVALIALAVVAGLFLS